MTDLSVTPPAGKPPFTLNGWHVLAMFVVFFGIIIAVDTLFVVKAYKTFSGEVAANPYETGIAWNRTLAQRRAEAALGWTVNVSEAPNHVIELSVTDRAGKPLDGLTVTGLLERPATEAGRLNVVFKPYGPGLYRTDPIGPAGAWDLSAKARDAQGHLFEAEKRFTWP
jgi:nitrogen fixation protein FixH